MGDDNLPVAVPVEDVVIDITSIGFPITIQSYLSNLTCKKMQNVVIFILSGELMSNAFYVVLYKNGIPFIFTSICSIYAVKNSSFFKIDICLAIMGMSNMVRFNNMIYAIFHEGRNPYLNTALYSLHSILQLVCICLIHIYRKCYFNLPIPITSSRVILNTDTQTNFI